MSQVANRHAIPALLPLLHDRSVRVRRAVATALASLSDPDIIVHLTPLLSDADFAMRNATIEALGTSKDPQIIPLLTPFLFRHSGQCSKPCGSSEIHRSSPLLMSLLADPDQFTRFHAVNTLRYLNDPQIIPALTAGARRPLLSGRSKAVEILGG